MRPQSLCEREDEAGSNCRSRPGTNCRFSSYGCCPYVDVDRVDEAGSNCDSPVLCGGPAGATVVIGGFPPPPPLPNLDDLEGTASHITGHDESNTSIAGIVVGVTAGVAAAAVAGYVALQKLAAASVIGAKKGAAAKKAAAAKASKAAAEASKSAV